MSDSDHSKVCTRCGNFIERDSNFCSKCGSSQEDFQSCPQCGKKMPLDGTYCAHCGNQKASGRIPQVNSLVFCSDCGNKIAKSASSCPECGAVVAQKKKPLVPTNPHSYGPLGLVLWGLYFMSAVGSAMDPQSTQSPGGILAACLIVALLIHLVVVAIRSSGQKGDS